MTVPPAAVGLNLNAGGPRALLALVLVPCAEQMDPELAYYYDFSRSRDEFGRAFAALGVEWEWLPVTKDSVEPVLADALARAGERSPVVVNLCDGDETNGVPGVEVIQLLDSLGVAYTGADAHFYTVTTSKIDMKRAFDDALLSTAPWSVVGPAVGSADQEVASVERIGFPAIVKPAVSAGSMGITTKSVVHDLAALQEQVRLLHDGYMGWNLTSGGIIAERYIAGPEFTVFIVGSADDPANRIVFPAVERVFHRSLPETEQFLSYDRLWEVYERETAIGDGAYLWEYAPAPADLQERIGVLSWEAYVAVGGCGYGRVDLRMDRRTGVLFVLEVNAQCGLSDDENETSIGAILRFAGHSWPDTVRAILADAIASRSAAAPVSRA